MPARSRAARCLVVIALLVVSGLVPSAAVATPDGTLDTQSTVKENTVAASSGNTTITLDIQSDGDAEWTITMTQTVSNDSAAADLTALARAYEDGETEYLSITPYTAAAQSVSDDVSREMEIEDDIARNGSVDNKTLRLSVSFTWTNFASQNDNEMAVRDVFSGSTGSWFGAGAGGGPGLTADQRLVIIPPDEYDISSVSRDASLQNGTIRWQGPLTFDEDSPYAVFRGDTTGTPTTTATTTITLTPTTTPTTTLVGTDPGNGDESNALLVPLVIFVIGLLAAVAYITTRGDLTIVPAGEEDTPTNESTVDDSDTDPTASSEPAAEESPSVGSSGAVAGADPTGEADDDVDEELLSDEEQVERLLEQNGGRMKQANIVSETGWSNAKVSQLLSSMADDGRIEKLRIGRENLISFPDEDITDDE